VIFQDLTLFPLQKGLADPGHFQKVVGRAQQLRKLIEEGLCGSDEAIAKGILQDLENTIQQYLKSGLTTK